MKLKKIASLALAGVMAVSMLAGCATNKPNPDPNPGEGEGTVTTTGYSAALEDKLGLDADDYGYISFKDNANDQAALEKTMEYISADSVKALALCKTPTEMVKANLGQYADIQKMMDVFADAIDTKNTLTTGMLSMADYSDNNGWVNEPSVRTGALYAVNGDVSTDAAVKSVAAMVENQIKALAENNTGAQILYDYSYVVSVSAATKTLQDSFNEASNSVTVIAVTVSRTVTPVA